MEETLGLIMEDTRDWEAVQPLGTFRSRLSKPPLVEFGEMG